MNVYCILSIYAMIFGNIRLNSSMFNYFKRFSWLKLVIPSRFCKGFAKIFPSRNRKNVLKSSASFLGMFTSQQRLGQLLVDGIPQGGKRVFASMNNLLKTVPFSQAEEVHEQIQMS